jgi:hypothetical protein
MIRKLTPVLALLLLPVAASASEAEADQCAASLSAEAKVIYDAVKPRAAASNDLQATVTEAVRSMVSAGQVSRSSARGSAQSAGQCLRMIQS